MTPYELKKLTRIRRLLNLAIGLLLISELGFLVKDVTGYIIGASVAALLLLALWYGRERLKLKSFKVIYAYAIPLLTILGPVFYLLIRWLFLDGSILMLDLFLLCCLIVSLLLLFGASKYLAQVIESVEHSAVNDR